MRKRFLCIVVAFTSFASPLDDGGFMRDVAEFEKHWVLFINGLAGCPPRTLYGLDAECDTKRGRFDLKEFNHAKRIAKKIFRDENRP